MLSAYLNECKVLAAQQQAVLNEVRLKLKSSQLTTLEENGMLHALQLLAENAIGKAKMLLKARNLPVPSSAYDAFKLLSQHGVIEADTLPTWNAIIGVRNRIVHEYMNINSEEVCQWVAEGRDQFIVDFLNQ